MDVPNVAHYLPPPGGSYVRDPRSVDDFPRKLAANYVFALTAYAHYLSLTSESHRYVREAIQLAIFLFFPMLPIIQLAHNVLKLIIFIAGNRSGPWNATYLVAAAFGMRTDYDEGLRSSYRILDIKPDDLEAKRQGYMNFKYFARLVFLVANATVSGLSLAAYVERLGIRFHAASFVGALGLDHRMAWMVIGGLTAVICSFPVQALNIHWHLRPRVVPPVVNEKLALCIETSIAALIQDQLQALTNHPSTFRILRRYLMYRIELVFFWIITIPLIAIQYRRRILLQAWLVIGLLWLALIAGVQLAFDIKEVTNIAAGITEEWNYRWAVNDPPWWSI